MQYDIISFLFTLVCTITGVGCTLLFIRLNSQKALKALQNITLAMVFYSIVAFLILIKRGNDIIRPDQISSPFSSFDGLAYSAHMVGNIFLLLFIRSLFQRGFPLFDKITYWIEGSLVVFLNVSYYLGKIYLPFLIIHSLISSYIYLLLVFESFRLYRQIHRDQTRSRDVGRSLAFMGASGVIMFLSILIFVYADAFVPTNPTYSWLYTLGWSFSAIFGITIYIGYLSPDLKTRHLIGNGQAEPALFFEQISFLRSTVEQLKNEINARKKLESLLRESVEKAMAASQAKSDFMANMSHELRTPLNSVIGFSRLLMDRSITSPDDQLEAFSLIHESGNHLLTLINDILDLAKIETGKVQCDYTSFHFYDLLQNVLSILRLKIEEKAITIQISNQDAPAMIVADETKIRQVLLNLLENAVKFSYPKGTIELTLLQPGTQFQFSVKDYGIGIKKEDLDHLFHPFTQIENVFSKKSYS